MGVRGTQKLQVDPTVADDLNEALGDPTPYQTKLLHIEYLIVGHDAERRTEAPEATASGTKPTSSCNGKASSNEF